MSPIRPPASVAFALLILACPPSLVYSQSSATETAKSAAELLPDSVILYAEIPQLGTVIDTLRNHPLRAKLESIPEVSAAIKSDEVKPIHDAVAAFEGGMGEPWQQALTEVTDGGIYFALAPENESAALLIRSSDAKQLQKFRNVALAVAQLGQGKLAIAGNTQYRGFSAHAIGDHIRMAVFDDWFVLTNSSILGRSIIDAYLDGGKNRLAETESFNALQRIPDDNSMRLLVDIQAIRESGVAPKVYTGRTDNPAAEALLGGIVANLQHTPVGLASVNLQTNAIELTVATLHEDDWGSEREHFFGANNDATAPPILNVPGRIAAVSAYRDLSEMWLRAPDLMTDKANEELAKADSALTTFFSGRDFGEDILGSLRPGIQMVVSHQTFAEEVPVPSIKLPSFATQFRMRTPEETTADFRRVFQNVVGFINVVGAMQGQPQLDLGFEPLPNGSMITTTYVPPRDEDEDTVSIHFNFSPTIAFSGDRMVIASTTALARSLIQHGESHRSEDDAHPNTTARLYFDTLAETLSDNRAQLVAQNMLEKGHSPQQAGAEIDVLLQLVAWIEKLSLDLHVDKGLLKLTTKIDLPTETERP